MTHPSYGARMPLLLMPMPRSPLPRAAAWAGDVPVTGAETATVADVRGVLVLFGNGPDAAVVFVSGHGGRVPQ